MNKTKKLTITASLIALGVIIPQFFHIFALSGKIFLPMHIPVILCGIICGGINGAVCGIITVFLSSFITGMPPLYPIAISMAFELAAYGLVSGLLYPKFKVWLSLLCAMVAGRLISGIANAFLLGLAGKSYAMGTFITGAFITSLPGIIIQLIAIPAIITILKGTKLINGAENGN